MTFMSATLTPNSLSFAPWRMYRSRRCGLPFFFKALISCFSVLIEIFPCAASPGGFVPVVVCVDETPDDPPQEFVGLPSS
jgi:hypothetical protein